MLIIILCQLILPPDKIWHIFLPLHFSTLGRFDAKSLSCMEKFLPDMTPCVFFAWHDPVKKFLPDVTPWKSFCLTWPRDLFSRHDPVCFFPAWHDPVRCDLFLWPSPLICAPPLFLGPQIWPFLWPALIWTPTYPLWQNIDHELRVIGTWCWNLSYKLSHVITICKY